MISVWIGMLKAMSEFLLAENLANVCDDEAQKAELYQEEGALRDI